LVVGVAPGELNGVEIVDPAELEDWLTPYTGGADGPAWNPDYVEIDGVAVLLISVEAPKGGDQIWTLRKTFSHPSGTTYPAGRIFLRRNGQTASEPTPAEITMLQRRYGHQDAELSVELEIEEGDPLSALDVTDGAKDRWLKRQREEMLSSLKRVQGKMAAEPIGSLASMLLRDQRTADEYRQEVAECLAGAEDAFAGMARTRAIDKGIGLLRLAVVNQTQDNLQGLLVELKVEGQVHAFFSVEEAVEAANAPRRPSPYGEEKGIVLPRSAIADSLPRHLLNTNPGHISNENSAWIKFPEIDLRPGYRHPLADLYLLADSSACGSQLEGRWVATSKSISGSLAETLTIGVAPSPIDIEDLRDPVNS